MIYNIKSKDTFDTVKQSWNTGNSRETIVAKPKPNPVLNFISCDFSISITGSVSQLNKCKYPTEAEHGTQPNKDLFIFL